MIVNVISFTNGKTLAFKAEAPFVPDENPGDDFITVKDPVNGQTLTFRQSQIVTVASVPAEAVKEKKKPIIKKVTE